MLVDCTWGVAPGIVLLRWLLYCTLGCGPAHSNYKQTRLVRLLLMSKSLGGENLGILKEDRKDGHFEMLIEGWYFFLYHDFHVLTTEVVSFRHFFDWQQLYIT